MKITMLSSGCAAAEFACQVFGEIINGVCKSGLDQPEVELVMGYQVPDDSKIVLVDRDELRGSLKIPASAVAVFGCTRYQGLPDCLLPSEVAPLVVALITARLKPR